MPDVRCSVSDCAYQKDSTCQAPALQVQAKGGLSQGAKVSSCADTQCQSFKPRR
ncbi:MAG: DUF1540 domain-containing protein [Acetobacteraceae bacterium]|nr:DUF1540 domain-containing protein [Acetobacteraceae bacterium]